LTHDPKEKCELISSAFAQALTALSFGYECEVFVLDNGIKMLQPEYIKGLKANTFNPLTELIQYYHDMGVSCMAAIRPSLPTASRQKAA